MTNASEKPREIVLLEGVLLHMQGQGESWTDVVERLAAEVVEKSPRTVWRWLSGDSSMTTDSVERLRDYLAKSKNRLRGS